MRAFWLVFVLFTGSSFNAKADVCPRLLNGLQLFAEDIRAAVGIARSALGPAPSAQSGPVVRHWRTISLQIGGIEESIHALQTYTRACAETSGIDSLQLRTAIETALPLARTPGLGSDAQAANVGEQYYQLITANLREASQNITAFETTGLTDEQLRRLFYQLDQVSGKASALIMTLRGLQRPSTP